ncbi:hypothetical protein PS854_02509 [Pseudomonas fluorescens]|uniref:Uncharacterized protein n=1 Tax=Pseudomonas fluorescens TaxID=294 RepID=A0A5E7K0B0_PSEFL|nr:hypothetical protein PS854_02509 [Pseudomonas fluorescens]
MVENPGMWVEERSLFEVGTVVGLLRIRLMVRPGPERCGYAPGRRGLGKRLDYRKVANDSTRGENVLN